MSDSVLNPVIIDALFFLTGNANRLFTVKEIAQQIERDDLLTDMNLSYLANQNIIRRIELNDKIYYCFELFDLDVELQLYEIAEEAAFLGFVKPAGIVKHKLQELCAENLLDESYHAVVLQEIMDLITEEWESQFR
ncbi:hypothetical protein NIES2100_35370 [Calothrix sp. NIES-2100]|uniref:hypothetical protein n=1 Tax=Calothrix sp. NIES-2100 TaxID=1954172 RepID=UPI000B5DC920|nr:hypothetical protein NIES2100_35370 [Calothrix sp. NIES-2100]